MKKKIKREMTVNICDHLSVVGCPSTRIGDAHIYLYTLVQLSKFDKRVINNTNAWLDSRVNLYGCTSTRGIGWMSALNEYGQIMYKFCIRFNWKGTFILTISTRTPCIGELMSSCVASARAHRTKRKYSNRRHTARCLTTSSLRRSLNGDLHPIITT